MTRRTLTIPAIVAALLLAPAALWLVSKASGRSPARARPFWHALGGGMAALVIGKNY